MIYEWLIAFFTELTLWSATGLIREHGQICFDPVEPMGEATRIETGEVREQWVPLTTVGKSGLTLRRIRVKLDMPDRNGEKLDMPDRNGDETFYLLTQVPVEKAIATQLADLYRNRWRIEVAFLKMTVQFTL